MSATLFGRDDLMVMVFFVGVCFLVITVEMAERKGLREASHLSSGRRYSSCF